MKTAKLCRQFIGWELNSNDSLVFSLHGKCLFRIQKVLETGIRRLINVLISTCTDTQFHALALTKTIRRISSYRDKSILRQVYFTLFINLHCLEVGQIALADVS